MARILVIEDNPENLELMGYLLQAFGHVALRAGDGAEGVEAARREAPDLIVCDIHLPGMDGYEVARHVKRNPALRSTPLVAVTALAMVGDRDKVLAAGFDGYIAKPIVPKRFLEQIESYLRAPVRRSVAPAPAPAVRSVAPPAAPSDAAPLTVTVFQGPQAHVLVVDDSPANRELLRHTLEPSGYATRIAGSIADGLAMAAERVPDLILSDLHLPGEGGFDFIRRAKADPRLAAVPFIIITSSIWSDRDRGTALELGAIRFLSRPIAPRALLDEIAACLSPQRGNADGNHTGR
jgi:two-component system cell cycle response regulator